MTFDGAFGSRARRSLQSALPVGLAALGFAGAAPLGCHRDRDMPESEAPPPVPSTPDRLTQEERLPESETAFGLPLPPGMHVTRHFGDSGYFSGPLDFAATLEHVRKHVRARDVEMMTLRAVFPRAQIEGDSEGRLFRIEISSTAQGSQLYIKNITPPPVTRGLSENEMWKRAGRKPDGSLIDPNQMY
jgi:hypothetical protein